MGSWVICLNFSRVVSSPAAMVPMVRLGAKAAGGHGKECPESEAPGSMASCLAAGIHAIGLLEGLEKATVPVRVWSARLTFSGLVLIAVHGA